MFKLLLSVLLCSLLVNVQATGPCRSCATIRCAFPVCKGETILDYCGCCRVCLKQRGEKCGGVHNAHGTCEKPLVCTDGVCSCPPLSLCGKLICPYGQMKTRLPNGCEFCKCRPKPDCVKVACKCTYGTIFYTDSEGCQKCSCKPKPVCPVIACKCTYKTIWFTDANGCKRCSCLTAPTCPKTSLCQLIKCAYGVIRFVDDKGCESCTCIPQQNSNVGPSCKPNGIIGSIDTCGKCICKKNKWRCIRPKKCATGFCYHNGFQFKHKQTRPAEDGCNTCTCNADSKTAIGNWGCTEKACPVGCSHKNRHYPVGSTRFEQCNRCHCGSNGLWGCTKIGCRTGVCYYEGKAVGNRKRFFDGCNFCTCHVKQGVQYGNVACTRRSCGSSCKKIVCTNTCKYGYVRNKSGCAKNCHCRKPKTCVHNGNQINHGTSTFVRCNRCFCRNGRLACTKKFCPTGFCYYQGHQLKDKESFYDGCNTCSCSVADPKKDGHTICTLKACPGCKSNIFCQKSCKHGYVSKNGCSVCACRPSPY